MSGTKLFPLTLVSALFLSTAVLAQGGGGGAGGGSAGGGAGAGSAAGSGSSSGAPTNSTTNPGGTTGSGTNPAGMGNPSVNSDFCNANDPNRPNDSRSQNRSPRRR